MFWMAITMQVQSISRFLLINDHYKGKNYTVMKTYTATCLVFLVVLFIPDKLTAQCESLIWADEFEGAEIDSAKWNINRPSVDSAST